MPAEVASRKTPETLPVITLSPERVGEALNLEADEVRAQLRSVEGRNQLLADLQRDPAVLASVIDPDSLQEFQRDMNMVQEDLKAEQRFLEAQNNPEKKGMFRRAWDTVTGFPRKHPVITVALLGVVLGVVASYMGWLPRINFSGLWGKAQGWFNGTEALTGEAAAGGVATVEAADTSALPVLPGMEAPIGTLDSLLPEAFRIRITGHEFLYENQLYSIEQLPDLLKKLPDLSGANATIRVAQYGDARASAEIALQEALQNAGISDHKVLWIPGMIDKEFIRLDQIPSGQ